MLGIRHIDGVALDFWVGAPPFFYCDRSYVFKGDMEKFSDFQPQTEVKQENLMMLTEVSDLSEIKFGSGHVAFSPMTGMDPGLLYDFIEEKIIGSHKGRVTVIFPTIDVYESYFLLLEKRFPENL